MFFVPNTTGPLGLVAGESTGSIELSESIYIYVLAPT